MKSIHNFLPPQKINRIGNIIVNQLCITVLWYIGYVEEIIEENYLVDHLKREFSSSNKTWMYPTKLDENVVEIKQILEVGGRGEWSLVDRGKANLC